ncbi:hypothetical protein NE237_001509 [Protea cynaroides]|uniref:Peroxin-7 n=1 Tax=Protea cynaroides TaxID=273540 RepID=A0A9Q0KT85_9MAGN|nr:hypothetical protein NE237_001509 [Protea cynaroides]
MPVFKTPFNGYAVKFSPFYENRLAVATAQNFGILGNGRVHVLDLTPTPNAPITELYAFDTADAVYDCTWSEDNDNLLVTAIADGSVKLWDLALSPTSNPIRSLHEHSREVQSVDWNPVRRDSFLTSSWDDTIKLWTVDRPASVRTFKEHAYCVYSSVWNPRHGDVFASASGDSTVRIWDVREPTSTMIIPAHDFEILSCDWNKYDDCIIATASVDKSIKVWDVRNFRIPITVLNGHSYAVRKVKFSPHRDSLIASCSYDMTVCLWDYRVEDALVGRYDHHTEFAVGIDMSVLVEGLFASTGWDEFVYVWQHEEISRIPVGEDNGDSCNLIGLLLVPSPLMPRRRSSRREPRKVTLMHEFCYASLICSFCHLRCQKLCAARRGCKRGTAGGGGRSRRTRQDDTPQEEAASKEDDPLHREAEEQDKMILLKKKLLVKEEDPLHREAEEQDKMILLKKKLLVKEEDPLHRSGLGALLNEPRRQIWFGSSSQQTRRRLGDSGPLLNANGIFAVGGGEDAWVIRVALLNARGD